MSENLPDELIKLEISPKEPLKKVLDMYLLNPFFCKETEFEVSTPSKNKSLFGDINVYEHSQRIQNCRKCRFRRRSESILEEYKSQSATCINQHEISPLQRTTLKVIKQPLKKNYSGGRKVVLREPILTALQRCFVIQNTARRKLLCAAESNTNCENYHDRGDICNSLCKFSVNRRTSTFTTMQDPTLRAPNLLPSAQSKPISLLLNNEHNSSLKNTSCSQQAASQQCSTSQSLTISENRVSSSDDVTIDELASYFDTLVHIPKKMSSMAEMMYI